MNPRRIYGVFLQEYYMTIHSLEIFVDVFVFPLINIVVFGLISLYLVGSDNGVAGAYVLLGMLLWQIIWIIAYSVAVGSMWNIWSRNLSNMFVAPLELEEYIVAHFLSGVVKALALLAVGAFLSAAVFHFNMLAIGWVPLLLTFLVFSIFAFAVAVVVLGLIFRYGTRIQALSWSLITIVQPFSAAFFPLADMPRILQLFAYLFPSTYGFEGARYGLLHHEVAWGTFGVGLLLASLYCIFSIFIFQYLYTQSRDTGQFARNES